jgi:hypothetical protein
MNTNEQNPLQPESALAATYKVFLGSALSIASFLLLIIVLA